MAFYYVQYSVVTLLMFCLFTSFSFKFSEVWKITLATSHLHKLPHLFPMDPIMAQERPHCQPLAQVLPQLLLPSFLPMESQSPPTEEASPGLNAPKAAVTGKCQKLLLLIFILYVYRYVYICMCIHLHENSKAHSKGVPKVRRGPCLI